MFTILGIWNTDNSYVRWYEHGEHSLEWMDIQAFKWLYSISLYQPTYTYIHNVCMYVCIVYVWMVCMHAMMVWTVVMKKDRAGSRKKREEAVWAATICR